MTVVKLMRQVTAAIGLWLHECRSNGQGTAFHVVMHLQPGPATLTVKYGLKSALYGNGAMREISAATAAEQSPARQAMHSSSVQRSGRPAGTGSRRRRGTWRGRDDHERLGQHQELPQRPHPRHHSAQRREHVHL